MRRRCKEGSIQLAVVSGPIRATNGGGLKASDSFFAGELWGRFGLHAAVVAPLHWSNRETRCVSFRAARGVVESAPTLPALHERIAMGWHGRRGRSGANLLFFCQHVHVGEKVDEGSDRTWNRIISLTGTELFISNKYNFIN